MAKIAFQTLKQTIRSCHRSPSRILDMSFEDKRKMLEHVLTVGMKRIINRVSNSREVPRKTITFMEMRKPEFKGK